MPNVEQKLNAQLVSFVQALRLMDLKKSPSISETVDWARALLLLHASALDADLVKETLNVILKFEQDVAVVEPQIREILNPPTEK